MAITLATRFGRNRTEFQSDTPIPEDTIRRVAPSIFAESPHDSRSQRYTFIPTIDVLRGLRKEGFEPFHVGQSKSRIEGKAEFTKHLVRLRHMGRAANARGEAPEIILVNSHDGTSSYQMLGGLLRFVCMNGLIHGDKSIDVRVPHKGDVTGTVIEGAYRVLGEFDRIEGSVDAMKAQGLTHGQELAFGAAALELRYDGPAPISAEKVIQARRREDTAGDLFSAFNRIQENCIRGGQSSRDQRDPKRHITTRPILGIDQGVKLNRALWVLAEELRKQIA